MVNRQTSVFNPQGLREYQPDSVDTLIERRLSYFDHLPTFQPSTPNKRIKTKHLYMQKNPGNNVDCVIGRPEDGVLVKLHTFGHNLVTDAGDLYYFGKSVDFTPAANENFKQARCRLSNPASAITPAKTDTYGTFSTAGNVIAASLQTIFTGYPVRSDTGDADNTGDAVDATTYKYEWATTAFAADNIVNGALFDNASPVSATLVLTIFVLLSTNKRNTDSMKVFVNHLFDGRTS